MSDDSGVLFIDRKSCLGDSAYLSQVIQKLTDINFIINLNFFFEKQKRNLNEKNLIDIERKLKLNYYYGTKKRLKNCFVS